MNGDVWKMNDNALQWNLNVHGWTSLMDNELYYLNYHMVWI
jgi:hypothetical protein